MRYLIFLAFALICLSCHSGSGQNSAYEPTSSTSGSSTSYSGEDEIEESDNGYEEPEVLSDGTYSATVDYYNENTGYSATYVLDVEVEDGQVTVIYFPNDGYLDDDHIDPSELDENNYAEIAGEDGKSYQVQIDL